MDDIDQKSIEFANAAVFEKIEGKLALTRIMRGFERV